MLMAGTVVRYMLFSHHEKPGVPVPRSKLNDAMMTEYADHPRKRKIPPVGVKLCLVMMTECAGHPRKRKIPPVGVIVCHVMMTECPGHLKENEIPPMSARRGTAARLLGWSLQRVQVACPGLLATS
eukprot:211595-Pelagomonas_calceolata.AAC.4